MKKYLFLFISLGILFTAAPALASGTIDSTNHYAWDNNGGWVNWDATNGNVTVTDSALTGYIWSANFGWINLDPTNGGITNDGSGNLGGWAWGQNTGWISFSGITIDSNGIFHGQTPAQNIFGIMNFDCTNCKVETTWRPSSSSNSSSSNSSNSGGGGVISGPLSVGYQTSARGTATNSNESTTTSSTAGSSTPSNTSTQSTPLQLQPTSNPPIQHPTTKPPASPQSSTYINQTIPSQLFPTSSTSSSAGQTVHSVSPAAQEASATPPASCSWFGACFWQSIANFFAHLFSWL